MVPAVILIDYFTLNIPYRTVQKRNVIPALTPFNPSEFFNPFGGKATRKLFLSFTQQVHGENSRLGKKGVALSRLSQTDEHQGRIERQGVKGIDREPVGIPIFIPGGYDGHASGKMAHHPPQPLRLHNHALSSSYFIFLDRRSTF